MSVVVPVGSLWRRNPPHREVVRVTAACWDITGPFENRQQTVSTRAVHGGHRRDWPLAEFVENFTPAPSLFDEATG